MKTPLLCRSLLASAILACAAIASSLSAMSASDRSAYLDWMKKALPDDPAFNEWLAKTGAQPPDFDALPRDNRLPDPLRFTDGSRVSRANDWPKRREEIRHDFEAYVTGTFPPREKLAHAQVIKESKRNGYSVREVKLIFGPDQKGSLRIQVALPDGAGPFPVLVHPDLGPDGPIGGWEPVAMRRGYIVVAYAGNDFLDDAAPLDALYPKYDFALLPRRAWVAHFVLDYIETLTQADQKRVAMYGYSRDGKVASIAMAEDERFAALIAGSTGVGGLLPFRTQGERGNGEGIETTTRMFPTWFNFRLRFFSGREDRLPVDGNSMLALIAPRPCLIEYGLNDEVSSSWGDEQSAASAQPVYDLLGNTHGIGLIQLPGFHGGNDQDRFLDWLDIQFGRSPAKWSYQSMFPWNYDQWKSRVAANSTAITKPQVYTSTPSKEKWEQSKPQLAQSIQTMLGESRPWASEYQSWTSFFRRIMKAGPPPGPTDIALGHSGNPGQLAPDVPAWVIARGGPEFGWLEPEKDHVKSRKVYFGANTLGDLYSPADAAPGQKLRTVIWLHGNSYPLGYMWVYRRDLHPILALVKAGFAVLAYDQSGYGSRQSETAPFYDRYPTWSRMGRLVEDVHLAIDALEKDAQVDAKHISLFGYTLGGSVALYSAAFDPRVEAVVSVCGFTPMRSDKSDTGLSGLQRYSQDTGLIPQLGQFVGHEENVPYDYEDLIALAAPRPVLIVQPKRDRDAQAVEVQKSVERARTVYKLYGEENRLKLDEPDDYGRLPNSTQSRAVDWLRALP